jgi:uncharacterized membrane protein
VLGSILPISDWAYNTQFFFRWFHVIFGIVWIGHLYFFNFVNSQVQPKLDKETKQKVNPWLLGRAFWWFRWGAMITFITGLVLFSIMYMYKGAGAGWGANMNFKTPDGLTQRAIWILIGMGCGFVMWINVWFVIWPRQSKIIRDGRDGKAPDPQAVKTATLASKMNTYLSAPMLFGMLGAHEYGSINAVLATICILGGLAIIWHLYKFAPKTGSEIGEGK